MKRTAKKSNPLNGAGKIPGDKSISHRALMLGGLAIGETVIHGLLEGEDVQATAAAMRAMGATISRSDDGIWRCHGVGIGGLREPEVTLDMGNSGTSTRLLMGLIGGHNITAQITGDASLTKRPMERVITPLEMMGAKIKAREGGRLPLSISGAQDTLAITYTLPVASAQVKSCIMLAGLSARGETSIIETIPTRDHTENMLRHFGVPVHIEKTEEGADKITVTGHHDLKGCAIHVPSDPSSAAFPTVAALLAPDSDITLPNILMNERRNGVYTTLIEMGANITYQNERDEAGEPVCDLHVQGSRLKGIDVPASRVPSMIDEFPILFVAAALAHGETHMTGLAELRVKESDRLLMMFKGLQACGIACEIGEDWMTIHGMDGKPPKGGVEVETALDHRIAMSFLVFGGVCQEPVTLDDASPIGTSFPNFIDLMNNLGANIS